MHHNRISLAGSSMVFFKKKAKKWSDCFFKYNTGDAPLKFGTRIDTSLEKFVHLCKSALLALGDGSSLKTKRIFYDISKKEEC